MNSTSMSLLVVLFLSGCPIEDDTVVEGPCPLSDEPELSFAMRDAVYEHVDGDRFWYGHPPQGGSPFAPFLIRVEGLESNPDGYNIALSAIERSTGEQLGEGDYVQRFICANVGENAGFRVAPELHMRFFGRELADLEGRIVDLEVELDDGAGTVLIAATTVVLTQDLQ